MKNYKELKGLELVAIKFVKNSNNGNPSYKLTFKDCNGCEVYGVTKTDSMLGYKICDQLLNKIYNVTYYLNCKYNFIISDIKEA